MKWLALVFGLCVVADAKRRKGHKKRAVAASAPPPVLFTKANEGCVDFHLRPIGNTKDLTSFPILFEGAKFGVNIGTEAATGISGCGVTTSNGLATFLTPPGNCSLTITYGNTPVSCDLDLELAEVPFYYVGPNVAYPFTNGVTASIEGGQMQSGEYYRDTAGSIHLNPTALEGLPTPSNWFRVSDGSMTDLTTEPGLANLNPDFVPSKVPGLLTNADANLIFDNWGKLSAYHMREGSYIAEFWFDSDADYNGEKPCNVCEPVVIKGTCYPYGRQMIVKFWDDLLHFGDVVDATQNRGRIMSQTKITPHKIDDLPPLPNPTVALPVSTGPPLEVFDVISFAVPTKILSVTVVGVLMALLL